jgi:predicted secreted protein
MSVIDNAFETKGTQLFVADFITNTDGVVTKLTCPTGLTSINAGTKAKIDTTCLDETGAFRTYIGGFADAAEVSAPFILYKGDASHQMLLQLQAAGSTVNWMVALSDAASVPTLDTDGKLVAPTDRTTLSFDGYIATLSFEAAINEVVRGTMTIQRTGFTSAHWAA